MLSYFKKFYIRKSKKFSFMVMNQENLVKKVFCRSCTIARKLSKNAKKNFKKKLIMLPRFESLVLSLWLVIWSCIILLNLIFCFPKKVLCQWVRNPLNLFHIILLLRWEGAQTHYYSIFNRETYWQHLFQSTRKYSRRKRVFVVCGNVRRTQYWTELGSNKKEFTSKITLQVPSKWK